MPWYLNDKYRFWVADHQADGIVIFSELVSFRRRRSHCVYLYVVAEKCWREYVKEVVRAELSWGPRFDAKYPQWDQQFQGWDDILEQVESQEEGHTSWFNGAEDIGHLLEAEPANRPEAAKSEIPNVRERLSGWPTASASSDGTDSKSDNMKGKDWTASFDDFDGGDWENYMGGPDT